MFRFLQTWNCTSAIQMSQFDWFIESSAPMLLEQPHPLCKCKNNIFFVWSYSERINGGKIIFSVTWDHWNLNTRRSYNYWKRWLDLLVRLDQRNFCWVEYLPSPVSNDSFSSLEIFFFIVEKFFKVNDSDAAVRESVKTLARERRHAMS